MLWNKSQARKEDRRFSKHFVTRDENGDFLSEARREEIETGVRLLTEEARAKLKSAYADDKDSIEAITFKGWKDQYIDDLMALARQISEQLPELAWCDMFYKPFL
ncbi:unnamed protein product [Tilletia laevis]|uniref:Uncharacterized protein n=2 Tax=Tilletia TaxID=13289 RepID=A0A177TZV2_9BASI|nr:hypothetical protein CF336_g7763 [Tilletia laevis]KAE8247452.1 hypothetical protein A4X03_0g7041 [Tilletia caries]KAE8187598.1 hypothetical protein CF335_g7125 [Tilletia laevis]CAD6886751.1 unnamed protein product [Tilletia caries]CAD6907118.1 unnamed protein product [Tilletia laevis]